MLIRQVGLLATLLPGTPLRDILEWRESWLRLWLRVLRDVREHTTLEDGLLLRPGFLDPQAVMPLLYPAAKLEATKSEAARGWATAEQVRKMIDSGSFSSSARLARRKRKGGTG